MADLPRGLLVNSVPKRRAPLHPIAGVNLLTNTLAPAGAVQAPFCQLNWPNPVRTKGSLAHHFLETVTYYTPPPIFPVDYQNPTCRRRVQQPDLVPNLVLNTLYVAPPVPFIRFDWQNPVIRRKVQAPYQFQSLTQLTLVPPPVLLGLIPNISAAANSGTHQYDLGFYFSGATSYAIDPAVESGWSFDTGTGILEIDTDDEDTFGPYTVTATNAQGDTESNAFTVRVSAWDQAGYVGGTAVSADAVMGTTFLDDETPVPAAAFFVNGFAHDDSGRRYVALWPGTGTVYFHAQQGVARRSDGAMIIDPSGTTATRLAGWALTARGEVIAVVDTPDVIHSGYGLLSTGELCVSEVG